jgi:hypothetical protein
LPGNRSHVSIVDAIPEDESYASFGFTDTEMYKVETDPGIDPAKEEGGTVWEHPESRSQRSQENIFNDMFGSMLHVSSWLVLVRPNGIVY